jgi:hypothetical protein
VLEGDLSDFSLPEVLQLLAFTSKSGRLTLRDGTRRGRIDVRDGRVLDVSADASRLPVARRLLGVGLLDADRLRALLAARDELPTDHDLVELLLSEDGDERRGAADELRAVLRDQHIDAAAELLRWHEGDFRFDASVLVPDEGSTADVAGLMEEVHERATAAEELEARLGDSDQRIAIRRPDDDVTVPAEGWALLALVDGRRTVDDVVRLSGIGDFAARRALVQLLDLGVVTVDADAGEVTDDELVAAHALLSDFEAVLGGAVPAAAAAGVPVEAPPPAVELDAGLEVDGAAAVDGDGVEGVGRHDDDAEVAEVAEVAGASETDLEPAVADDDGRVPAASVTEEPGADEAAAGGDEEASVSALRTKVRPERLTTDPSIDASLVERLIEGVEALS